MRKKKVTKPVNWNRRLFLIIMLVIVALVFIIGPNRVYHWVLWAKEHPELFAIVVGTVAIVTVLKDGMPCLLKGIMLIVVILAILALLVFMLGHESQIGVDYTIQDLTNILGGRR